jgi:hypothetical protein
MVTAAWLSLLWARGAVAAQSQSQPNEDLLRRIEALQQTLEKQAQEIEELRRQLSEQAPASPAPVAPAPTPQATQSSQQTTQSLADERRSQRQAENPPAQLATDQFPGSFPIPGSDAALRIGGLVRVSWDTTNNALGVEDRFVTSAIPVEGTKAADAGARVNVSARPSRFNLDLRTPTGNTGDGIGRYISDLAEEGGQDGVYDSNLTEIKSAAGVICVYRVRALMERAPALGVQRWRGQGRNLDIQPDDALHLTRRYAANFIFSPISRLDLVTEFLSGVRINRDQRRGRANQAQVGGTFRF